MSDAVFFFAVMALAIAFIAVGCVRAMRTIDGQYDRAVEATS